MSKLKVQINLKFQSSNAKLFVDIKAFGIDLTFELLI